MNKNRKHNRLNGHAARRVHHINPLNNGHQSIISVF